MMDNRYLVDRREIAYAMNFGKFPVLGLNRENRPMADISPESDYCTGDKCKVVWDREGARYEGMTTLGHVYMENGRYAISNSASCLSVHLGYSDVMECLEDAKAQTVHKGQQIVLVESYPSKNTCTVSVMKVSTHIDIHCMTVATIEQLTKEEAEEWKNEYNKWQRKTY